MMGSRRLQLEKGTTVIMIEVSFNDKREGICSGRPEGVLDVVLGWYVPKVECIHFERDWFDVMLE